jgi:uncharacterized protein YndB with AHSA1/START domain
MTNSIRRELVLPQAPEEVWQALTDRAALAEWMYPNDFEPQVGHQFTFRVPANPKAGFDGVVRCEVLQYAPPRELAYSWSGGPVVNTRVSYRLEQDGTGTRLFFEHSGFDVTESWGQAAFQGAEFGWTKMLERLLEVAASNIARR